MRTHRSRASLLLLLVPGLVAISCGGGSTEQPLERGQLVSTRRVATIGPATIAGMVSPLDPDVAGMATHAVNAYQLVYVTRDPHDQLVRVSGMVMVPDTLDPVAMVSIQHDTITLRSDVASVSPASTPEGVAGLLLASAGHLVLLPDYQGYGVSTALHPYLHASSLSAAVIDLLIAAEEAAPGIGAHHDGRLFLTGYSEGGYATLAAHRELEASYSDRFHVSASVPMAGPYDLSGTARSMLATPTYPFPAYIAFFLTAYDDIHGWNRLAEIFEAPYAGRMPGLFDGTLSFGAINGQLPAAVSDLLKDAFVQGVLDGSETGFIQAVSENDLLDWIPVAPVRFIHGDADDAVPYENALTAVARLSSPANTVELVTISGGTHETAGLPALLEMIRWLDAQ